MISLDDSLADRQPNAGAGIFVSRVESFKQAKDALLILCLDAEAVIADREEPAFAFPPRRYVYHRCSFWPAIFYRVTHQILEQLLKLRRMDAQRG